MNDTTKFRITVMNAENGKKYYVAETNNPKEVFTKITHATDEIKRLKPLFISNVYMQLMVWSRGKIEVLLQGAGLSNCVAECFATEAGEVEFAIEKVG